MKRLLVTIFCAILIFHGISLLLFVIRMMWFPPGMTGMMGMMMGRQMMHRSMFYWFAQTFWLSIILAGIILFIWMIRENRKKK